jgi:hypothetical protein
MEGVRFVIGLRSVDIAMMDSNLLMGTAATKDALHANLKNAGLVKKGIFLIITNVKPVLLTVINVLMDSALKSNALKVARIVVLQDV